jgi:NAD(P)-dependent dehydrogenase (short-subunit alcohol dehydrogenase family)
VRVNCVAPAVIETPLLDQLRPEAIEWYRPTPWPPGPCTGTSAAQQTTPPRAL